jgi:hypothetical protein
VKERLAGFLLMTAIVPLAIAGYLLICCVGFFGRTERARAGVRALDHFVNATLFNGYAWESVSSHAWRVRTKRWARVVIWITDQFQPDHCRRANRREQPLVDLALRKRLHEKTIGSKSDAAIGQRQADGRMVGAFSDQAESPDESENATKKRAGMAEVSASERQPL